MGTRSPSVQTFNVQRSSIKRAEEVASMIVRHMQWAAVTGRKEASGRDAAKPHVRQLVSGCQRRLERARESDVSVLQDASTPHVSSSTE
jgi:hypothetical protein